MGREAATLAKVRGLKAGAMEKNEDAWQLRDENEDLETEDATGGSGRLPRGEGEDHGER